MNPNLAASMFILSLISFFAGYYILYFRIKNRIKRMDKRKKQLLHDVVLAPKEMQLRYYQMASELESIIVNMKSLIE
jgi:hypothetical protein